MRLEEKEIMVGEKNFYLNVSEGKPSQVMRLRVWPRL